jgi:hypothetical protein
MLSSVLRFQKILHPEILYPHGIIRKAVWFRGGGVCPGYQAGPVAKPVRMLLLSWKKQGTPSL